MTPERWQQIEQLYHAALEREPAERAAFLAQACAGDEALQQEVATLLAAYEEAGSFIEKPPDDVAAGVCAAAPASELGLPSTPATAASLTGRTLGHYQLGALLGAGGMGEVYRARDTRLDREVAVKILPEHLAANPEALHRFEREARAVAALSHPNILAIFDFGTEHGLSYAVLELLEGQTLRQRLSGAPLPWTQAAEIGDALAEGLAAAHAKGIIHRDLKPENIFLTDAGQVKILDFGIARVKGLAAAHEPSTQTTKPGTVLGTYGYMSPEQVRGETVEAPGDIFSLGCVFYEMLAGARPFARATMAETLAAILRDEPLALADSGGQELPAELARLVNRCLKKAPAERYQSARELAGELKALAGGSGAHASVQPQARPRARFSARPVWPVWPVLLTAALLLLLGLAAAGYYAFWREPALDSLAIMPLLNASGDVNAEYLSDGISEDLINHLSLLSNLRVPARSTVFRFKGKEFDPRQAGKDLNVRAVLTGKVTQRQDTVSIIVELVKTADGSHLWGEHYRRQLSDLLALQEEITRQISWNLRLTLSGPQRQQLEKRYTQNLEAYQLYLKGRYQWNQRTPPALRQSIDYFQQAIDKDPRYALAYSGLADAWFILGPLGLNALPAKDAIDKQRAAATRALELDDMLAEAHTSLAVVRLTHDWNWMEAEQAFQRALKLKPSYAVAHSWYAACLTTMGRFAEGIVEIKRAQELDPFSLGISNTVAGHHYYARQYEQAVAQYRKTIAMNPQVFIPHADLAQVYEQQGKFDEAVAELEQALKLSERSSEVLATLGHVYATAGRRAEAQKILDELNALAKGGTVSPLDFALVHAGLGQSEQAFAWLDKAVAERAPALIYLKVDQRFERLRADPRFAELLGKLKLSP